MSSIRNPLALLFGASLRNARKTVKSSSEQTAKNIFGSPRSTYRKIEAGIIILHSRYAIDLCKTKEFRRWNFSKITRFLSAAEYLESRTKDFKSLSTGIDEIKASDRDLHDLIYSNFLTTVQEEDAIDKLKKNFTDDWMVNKCIKFLEQSENAVIQKTTYNKYYEKIQSNSLCVLSPIVDDLLLPFKEELERIGDIGKRYQRLKIKVEGISKVEMSFPSTSSSGWRKGRKFKGMLGVIHKHQNLRNQEILSNHQDNFGIILNNEDKREEHKIHYVIISENEKEVKKTENEFYRIVYDHFVLGEELEKEEFKSKIIFHHLSPSKDSALITQLDMENENQELWLYNESETNYIFGFKAKLEEENANKPVSTGYADYRILKNREIKSTVDLLKNELHLDWHFNLFKSIES